MDITFSEDELFILKKIGTAADILKMPCYLIGGFVRDKILGRETKDMDIVCVGDGIILAQKVAMSFEYLPSVNVFKNFGTAQIKSSEFEIEFVGSRKESYEYNSRKPEIEQGTLEDDQNRRDFTINALAICLNKTNFGILTDPFNGRRDIEEKVLQTPLLPEKTFSDDPLRMLAPFLINGCVLALLNDSDIQVVYFVKNGTIPALLIAACYRWRWISRPQFEPSLVGGGVN